MHWTRHGPAYRTELDGEAIDARREPGGWRLRCGDAELRVANPRLKTWLRARPVLEQVLRARRGGGIDAPTTPSWSDR